MPITLQDIVRFIDELEWHMVERPQMYATTAEAMEGILFVLERIRAYVTSGDPRGMAFPREYTDYTQSKGLGVAGFAGGAQPPLAEKDLRLLQEYAEFVRSFLEKQKRDPPTPLAE